MKFCPSRWLESLTVAEQAINTWLSVLKVIKYYEGLAPSNRPKNKSYETLVNCVKDQPRIIKFPFSDILLTIFKHSKRLRNRCPYRSINELYTRNINEKIFEVVHQKCNCRRCKHPISVNQNRCE